MVSKLKQLTTNPNLSWLFARTLPVVFHPSIYLDLFAHEDVVKGAIKGHALEKPKPERDLGIGTCPALL